MTAEPWIALGALVTLIGGAVMAFLRGKRSGREAAEREQLRGRVEAAEARANADAAAGRVVDPADELRRQWSRGL